MIDACMIDKDILTFDLSNHRIFLNNYAHASHPTFTGMFDLVIHRDYQHSFYPLLGYSL